MNQKEYEQACLFRVREALQTTTVWWENISRLDQTKIVRTISMLEDTITELRYFNEKISPPGELNRVPDYAFSGLYKE